ncbi:PREDICTED: tyrosine-protein kinase CSK-like [Priapulus caudatus]|uniref:Tyrosine-protein kinase n=1 Tax=Priapulus caudatus TaxID=37621 RepID=A0ABM1E074_PRICU|nr:PREDICTED: tyrosine-protein kinase CSK-like [Priapulus caudatus]
MTSSNAHVNVIVPIFQSGTTVLAKFEYKADSNKDLSFKKNEILTIVEHTRDPNWYKAEDVRGRRGLVPANYLTPCTNPGRHHSRSHAVPAVPHPYDNGHNINDVANTQSGEPGTRKKLGDMIWFHGKITRDRAEQVLHPRVNGLFLVRESTNYPGDYTLCVVHEGKVEHYRILYKNNLGKFTIDEEDYFADLESLVMHYESDADGLCTSLTQALAKSDNEGDTREFLEGFSIRREELELIRPIGKGEFGDVFLGTYKGEKVAAKQLKEQTRSSQLFLEEASVMTSLSHPNLVKLLGIVFGQTYFIVTQYMALGNLVDYLRTRGRNIITKQDQINFASDACSGMAYLESKNIVHRDLAARNILIAEDGSAKVSDFGLAKESFGDQEGATSKFPIKWTAPEALRQSKFSNKSDMWSFGILLWELYSFGRVPYPRIPLADVVKHVEKGYRMECPEGCPKDIYEIMLHAWDLDPDKRPPFSAVAKQLMELRSMTI